MQNRCENSKSNGHCQDYENKYGYYCDDSDDADYDEDTDDADSGDW